MTRFVIATSLLSLLSLASAAMAQVTSAAPTGIGSTDPLDGVAAPRAIVSLSVSPGAVSTCGTLNVTWSIENDSADVDLSEATLLASNVGVSQTVGGVTFAPVPVTTPITVIPLSRLSFSWFVFIADPGYYVINGTAAQTDPSPTFVQSDPFLIEPSDTSCLSSSSSSVPDSTPPVTPSQSESQSPLPSDTAVVATGHSSNTAAIIGGTVAAIIVVAFIIVFWLLRRRRNKLTNHASGLGVGPQSAKGHHRKWGGLSSIDKLQQGEIPVVIPSNSPYTSPTYNRTRSHSTGHALTDEEGMEKGYDKHTFPVDADLLSEMPTLDSNRASRRYSSDFSTMVRQSSGVASYADPYRRDGTPGLAAPILTMTTATSNGGDDPFTDTAFSPRSAKRVSALSVPSTARAPSRVSEVSVRGPPSPVPTPTTSAPPSQANTMVRNASATASVGRPSRKPVPQYSDDSIELTNTNKSSPTSRSPLSAHPSRSNTGPTELSSSPSSRNHSNSPTDSSTQWLHGRAPMANRNIGLAGQGEGPVHYLMPDLPPPSAE